MGLDNGTYSAFLYIVSFYSHNSEVISISQMRPEALSLAKVTELGDSTATVAAWPEELGVHVPGHTTTLRSVCRGVLAVGRQ